MAVPSFHYGTAWKEEQTRDLVAQALRAGFRGIDTANQRRHYHEAGVGEAITKAFDRGELRREDLFLQTKFTYRIGQDHRLPYDPEAPVGEQVQQSFRSSLEHLGVERIDSYVLHGPSQRYGLSESDYEVWRTMEQLHDEGRARLLGVSNVSPDQLEALCAEARVQPAFVQNRCFAKLSWDQPVREVCDRLGIVYQGFSLLTANRAIVEGPEVGAIASRHGRTPAQVIFRFALAVGMIPLTGTTDPQHMAQDLEAYDFQLSDEEVQTIATAAL
jgi:diketogulonate reductase-like aldo/keto reductase